LNDKTFYEIQLSIKQQNLKKKLIKSRQRERQKSATTLLRLASILGTILGVKNGLGVKKWYQELFSTAKYITHN
jgi:hypothetical protein